MSSKASASASVTLNRATILIAANCRIACLSATGAFWPAEEAECLETTHHAAPDRPFFAGGAARQTGAASD
jgi:hypothetical protein